MAMTAPDFQSFLGPGDKNLVQNGEQGSLINGYQPVSRIGEVVMNSFGAWPATPVLRLVPTAHSPLVTARSRCVRVHHPSRAADARAAPGREGRPGRGGYPGRQGVRAQAPLLPGAKPTALKRPLTLRLTRCSTCAVGHRPAGHDLLASLNPIKPRTNLCSYTMNQRFSVYWQGAQEEDRGFQAVRRGRDGRARDRLRRVPAEGRGEELCHAHSNRVHKDIRNTTDAPNCVAQISSLAWRAPSRSAPPTTASARRSTSSS